MASERDSSRSGLEGVVVKSLTSWAGFVTGNGRRITAFIKLKIAVFAPMPKARETIAMAVVMGLRRSIRTP